MQGSRRVPLGLDHPGRVFVAIFAITIVLDQVVKAFVRVAFNARFMLPTDALARPFVAAALHPGDVVVLIPSVIHAVFVQNRGAAFGIFQGWQPIFMVTSVVVLIVIALYWYRVRPAQWPLVVALALISAGAAGNLIDRALLGSVTDFLEFSFIDFPVFNVADCAIVGGVGILMAWILFAPGAGEDDGAETVEASDPASECTPEPVDGARSSTPGPPTSASPQ